jgi:hypothetical protein
MIAVDFGPEIDRISPFWGSKAAPYRDFGEGSTGPAGERGSNLVENHSKKGRTLPISRV